MDTTSLQSTLNKAREQFENGYAKTCVETLKGVLEDLKVGVAEPEWYRMRNDVTYFLGKANSLERERGYGILSEQTYVSEGNRLLDGVMRLLLDFEAVVKEMGAGQIDLGEEHTSYVAELTFDLDYEKTDLEEIRSRVSKIENVLRIKSKPKSKPKTALKKRIIGTKPGSIIIKLELYGEEIVKIKSLVMLGLVDSALSFKVLELGWDWIEKEEFVLQLDGMDLKGVSLKSADLRGVYLRGVYLSRADLSGANLSGADFREANLSGADLIGADLSRADLRGAYLRGADLHDAYLGGVNLRGAYLGGVNLIRANLIGADLSGAKLSGTKRVGAYLRGAKLRGADLIGANLGGADLGSADLHNANLREANLRGADLSEADLSEANLHNADLSDVKLNRTIFHEEHRLLLQSMNMDISKVIFVDDDDGKSVESLVEV